MGIHLQWVKRTYEFAVLWISNIPFEAGHLVVMTFSLQLLLITTMKGSFIFSHRPLGEEFAKALLLLEVLYFTRAVYMSKTTKGYCTVHSRKYCRQRWVSHRPWVEIACTMHRLGLKLSSHLTNFAMSGSL